VTLANLSLAEFLALAGAVAAAVTLLYLLDRSRRRQVVATLRFWRAAATPFESRRWRIHQPVSWLLQLAALLLLLLAIGDPTVGGGSRPPRDHILILDTSAWMGARTAGVPLMETARRAALAWLDTLPAPDRVLVLRADVLATPATQFERDRSVVRAAIESAAPGSAALHLGQALDFAERLRSLHAANPGEIVFAGSRRSADEVRPGVAAAGGLRYLPADAEIENVGIRRIGLRHSTAEAGLWEVFVVLRNYGRRPRAAELGLQFAGAPAGYRRIRLEPGGEQEILAPLRTRAAGTLDVRVFSGDEDGYPGDDRAALEVPARHAVRLAVYTSRPVAWQPLVAATPQLRVEFRRPDAPLPEPAGIVVLDRIRSPAPIEGDAVWVQPPLDGSPLPVREASGGARTLQWLPGHPLATGLRSHDFRVRPTLVFQPGTAVEEVARVDEGPVIVAGRGGAPAAGRWVLLGIDPAAPSMRYELAAPLFFANVLRWMAPGVFRHWELNVVAPGGISVPLEEPGSERNARVLSESGEPVPFTVEGGSLTFFAPTAASVRVMTGAGERVYSLSVPALAVDQWDPPPDVARGVPPARAPEPAGRRVWPWLALLAWAILAGEWIRYGDWKRSTPRPGPAPGHMAPQPPGPDGERKAP
jgi:hypothetical protein